VSQTPFSPSTVLYCSPNEAIQLGKRIGSGGEGDVFEVVGQPDVLAKIYHEAAHESLDEAKVAKLRYMAQIQTPELLNLTAWVTHVLYRSAICSSAEVVGFLMPRLHNHKPIHELYNVKSRKTHFPQATWQFLIHTATNVARAFAVVHTQKHVIGDVNHTSLWVSAQGTVRLLDCDSFQIRANNRIFHCKVGVPEFTPPELQGADLDSTERNTNHDHFGLAAIIFHLLFLGRHPFSGVFLGEGEMSVPRAIYEGRFAYGKHALGREMRPPPFTLPLDSIPPKLVQYFQLAFTQAENRPTTTDWIEALEALSQSLKTCPNNSTHQFWQGLPSCPWCELEFKTGSALFGATNLPMLVSDLGKLNLPVPLYQKEISGPEPSTYAVELRQKIDRRNGLYYMGFLALFSIFIFTFGINIGIFPFALIAGKPITKFLYKYFTISSFKPHSIEQAYISAQSDWMDNRRIHGKALELNSTFGEKRSKLKALQEQIEKNDKRHKQELARLQSVNPQASDQQRILMNQSYLKEKQSLERSFQNGLAELHHLHAELSHYSEDSFLVLNQSYKRFLQAKADFDFIFANE
jgi:hypothetical protein